MLGSPGVPVVRDSAEITTRYVSHCVRVGSVGHDVTASWAGSADPLWGPDEDWKLLIDQTTIEADSPAPPPFDQVDIEETTVPPAFPDDPQPISTAEKHEAELAALEADLQDLFHP